MKGERVRELSKRLIGCLMAACLLATFAWGGQVAFASGDFPPEGPDTLTIAATASTDETLKKDIANADVVVDVYKVADATPNDTYVKYDYALIAPFGEGAIDYSSMDATTWQKLADEAAKVVTASTPHQTVAADNISSLALPGDGLYLLMPHGRDVTPEYGEAIISTLTATGEIYEYFFLPSLIAAPTKEADASGTISTAADAGDWLRAIAVALKPEYKEKPTPPGPTPPEPTPPVKTGDNTELLPYYIAMATSGVLLVSIALGILWRRRASKADGSGKGDAR